MIPEKLVIASERARGTEKTRAVKLATFLSWFGVKRRGVQVIDMIRDALNDVGLKTEPDFATANPHGRIKLIPNVVSPSISKTPTAKGASKAPQSKTEKNDKATIARRSIPDPTPRLGTFFGGQKPVTITRDSSVRQAITLMLQYDYSQLPVMQNSRAVDGLISWKSIGEAFHAKGKTCEFVRDCMESDVEILSSDTPLWKAIKTIADNDVVLVRDRSNEIVGLVTHSDISNQYHLLAEPFVLIGEIENNLRQLIVLADISTEELQDAKDPRDTNRVVNDVSDLTFGEYIRFFEKPEIWARLKLKNLSKREFVSTLSDIAKIRNEIMHFSPDPIDREKMEILRRTARLLRGFKLFD